MNNPASETGDPRRVQIDPDWWLGEMVRLVEDDQSKDEIIDFLARYVRKQIMYNGWERWITTTGMKIQVGDGTTRTFHTVMATWYDETPKNKMSNESEDDENFGEDGYLSERACSRHSLAWQ